MRLTALLLAPLMVISGFVFANNKLPEHASLERRPLLGLATEADEAGVRVASIVPGSSAETADIEVGDVLISVNGVRVSTPAELAGLASNLEPERDIELEVRRNERIQSVSVQAVARPFEQPGIGRVRYGHFDHAGGRIRAIINTPDAQGPFPTVYYIQGWSCGSVESSNVGSFNRRKVRYFVEAGFAVVRVEKPGVGDSEGPLECDDIDLHAEIDGFASGWEYAVGLPESRDDQMIMVGISMGGVQAPLVAAQSEHKPLGIIVWGTRMDNWHDYMYQLIAVQPVLLGAADPVEAYALGEAARPALRRMFIDQQPVDEILAEDLDAAAVFERIGMSPDQRFLGRTSLFFQQIATLDLRTAWRDAEAAVLSLYGASDIAAINGFDQQVIATVVNFYRPGTASFEVIPDTTHAMIKIGSLDDYRSHFQQGTMPSMSEGYNPAAPERMVEWSLALLADADGT